MAVLSSSSANAIFNSLFNKKITVTNWMVFNEDWVSASKGSQRSVNGLVALTCKTMK